MDSVDNEDLPSVIIGIDFERAFDSLEWSFVERMLSVFNFSPSIITWVQTRDETCLRNGVRLIVS